MSEINWKDDEVCYADGEFWLPTNKVTGRLANQYGTCIGFQYLLERPDFQLNEIKTGGFIPASELDTEQKYNDFFDALKLCGVTGGIVECIGSYSTFKNINTENKVIVIHDVNDQLWAGIVSFPHYLCIREFNFCQIIAIGKLKRMMLEREKSAPKTTPEHDDQVKNPKHYQLIEGVESIEIIARSMTKEQWKGFCLGNMLKYRIRAGKKDALQQDIEKANFYGELYEMHKEKCYD